MCTIHVNVHTLYVVLHFFDFIPLNTYLLSLFIAYLITWQRKNLFYNCRKSYVYPHSISFHLSNTILIN